jgi:2-polyprenyl-3-methyl-5-hydroxy-6-metoxy-1,4-benzoquinol methylase
MKSKFGEQPSNYYDNFFINSPIHKMQARELDFSILWYEVSNRILIRNAKTVLDLGCGVGHFCSILYSNGFDGKYIGEDFSKIAIEMANKNNYSSSAEFILSNIKYGSVSSIEVITAFEVLEHIRDDDLVINRISKDSIIYFTVPNIDCLGHARYFESKTEVQKYYESKLLIESIEEFELIEDQLFWLVTAKRN